MMIWWYDRLTGVKESTEQLRCSIKWLGIQVFNGQHTLLIACQRQLLICTYGRSLASESCSSQRRRAASNPKAKKCTFQHVGPTTTLNFDLLTPTLKRSSLSQNALMLKVWWRPILIKKSASTTFRTDSRTAWKH